MALSIIDSVFWVLALFSGMIPTLKFFRQQANPPREGDEGRQQHPQPREDISQILRYWVVLLAFYGAQKHLEFLISWMPLYGWLKTAFIAWVALTPNSNAEKVIEMVLAPMFNKTSVTLEDTRVVAKHSAKAWFRKLYSFLNKASALIFDQQDLEDVQGLKIEKDEKEGGDIGGDAQPEVLFHRVVDPNDADVGEDQQHNEEDDDADTEYYPSDDERIEPSRSKPLANENNRDLDAERAPRTPRKKLPVRQRPRRIETLSSSDEDDEEDEDEDERDSRRGIVRGSVVEPISYVSRSGVHPAVARRPSRIRSVRARSE